MTPCLLNLNKLPYSRSKQQRNQIGDDHCVQNLPRENTSTPDFCEADAVAVGLLHRNATFWVYKLPFSEKDQNKSC